MTSSPGNSSSAQANRLSGVAEDADAFACGSGVASGAAGLHQAHAVAGQQRKEDFLGIANRGGVLVADMSNHDDQLVEVEIAARGLMEPTQQDGGAVGAEPP
ncbi:hypothetical protein [Mycobacterium sp. URHB0021]